MGKHFGTIVWGIVFILININIGFIDILPNVVGYILITSAVSKLYDKTEIKEFHIATYVGSVCVIVRIITFFLFLSQNSEITILSTVIGIIVQLLILVLAFYMYEAVIKLLEKEKARLVEQIKSGRNFFLYVQLIASFIMTFSLNVAEGTAITMNFICACAMIITMIVWAVNMNTVKKYCNGQLKNEDTDNY
ncbi:hypothetical protein [Vallitalea maricola]|uniref:Uncharacterized protein n=1 Tax=Vallitalea maricola TaxID=3074433 RepID=A0ACB5UHM8_9FIRM|nr:hypothetical protein AN2V17_06370 [Vallitalea sp. AN17-2]